MRLGTLTVLLIFTVPAFGQNWYIPDNNPSAGIVNVIPFGNFTTGAFSNCKMQMVARAGELGNVANLITGIGISCAGSGVASFDALEIVMDHFPSGQALQTTFSSNLTASAQTVLSGTDYKWHVTADTWSEVGLQNLFVFNGVDDVIIQITTTNGISPAGMRRGTNERLYWFGSSGTPAATGYLGNSATKFEISMEMARASTYGAGCVGVNGTPELSFSGSPQINSVLNTDLNNGEPNGFAFFIAGNQSQAPYPMYLGAINMPGCYLYTDLVFASLIALDATGAGSLPLAMPATAIGAHFYTQYACLDVSANGLGVTVSNYGRVLVGF
jgi:hypothetical protein